MRAGMFFGILGVLVGVSVAAFALLVYVFNGTNSPGNPYASPRVMQSQPGLALQSGM